MKRIRIPALMLISVLLFSITGCSKTEEKPSENALKIFCTDTGMTQLFWEYYEPKATDTDELIDELIEKICEKPSNSLYITLKPDNVLITGYYYGKDNQIVINFNSDYEKMDSVREVLLRAGMVKTLCQIEDVSYVEFTVNDMPLMLRGERTVGRMYSEDFIDNTGDNTLFRQNINMTIYFADAEGKMLEESMLMVESDGSRSMAELVMEQLINGPLSIQTDLYPVIPEGTKLNKTSTRDGICYVDFNESFMNRIEGITDEVAIYSVVNSLVEMAGVNKVKFTINGEDRKSFGEIPFSGFFERKPDLITNEKAGD